MYVYSTYLFLCGRRGANGMLPIHMACLSGYADCVENLITPEMNLISETDNDKRTCLHAAACGGNLDCLELMIGQGCDINARDKHGRTPLHYATSTAQFQCILSLVANGAAVNVFDNKGCTPLHFASAADADANCVTHLLRNGSKTGQLDSQGYSPLHYAAAKGHKLVIQQLMDRLPDDITTNNFDTPQTTPLHLAVS